MCGMSWLVVFLAFLIALGGVTVFNALHKYNLAPTETVAVLGMGGLGHGRSIRC